MEQALSRIASAAGEGGNGVIGGNGGIGGEDAPGDMECRVGCGACCIALSISSPIPGMPQGKPAGVRCAQLSDENLCLIFGRPERPEVCVRLRPWREMCGERREDALAYLAWLEAVTAPAPAQG